MQEENAKKITSSPKPSRRYLKRGRSAQSGIGSANLALEYSLRRFALVVDRNRPGIAGQLGGRDLSARPAHPDAGGALRKTKHAHGAILRPVAAAGMDFPHGTQARPKQQPDLSSNTCRVAFGT